MKYINFDNFNRASYSFAVEEYIINSMDFSDEYFLFWRTLPTVMVGRFQNTVEEINLKFVQENNIEIIRRNSGGGTIFTDENCWQFSFITWKENDKKKDFRNFTQPIIGTLEKLGIKTEFSGRNDLMFNGKKFSGNAQFSFKNRFLHHGSMLFDVNIENLVKSINPSDEKIISKGIKSVKERVINLKQYLSDNQMDSIGFRNALINILCENMETVLLSENDLKSINKIEQEKFLTWDWNFGKSPDFNFNKSKRFDGGKVEILLFVNKGYIKDIKINGDFFFSGNIIDFQNEIIGCKYEKTELFNLFSNLNIEKYFYNIKIEELLSCCF